MARSRARLKVADRKALEAAKKNKNLKLVGWTERTAILILALGVAAGAWQWNQNRIANQKAAKLVAEANQGINHSVPSTNKPSDAAFNNYTVPGANPRYIFIPKIGVQAIVRNLGLTKDGELAAPDNVYDAGWFNQSAKPGRAGATVIDGHVSSWTTKGIFYSIGSLRPGDTIRIQRGDNTNVNYTVVKSQTYANNRVDMNAVLSSVNPQKPGLNLITCTGEVIKGTNEFNKRIVVFAQQS